ncbi:MAG: hypothetical protein IT373_08985 [Polyangiaceae bacterium]|nr:hypothetical protein [Polyangiaceae bacterium]
MSPLRRRRVPHSAVVRTLVTGVLALAALVLARPAWATGPRPPPFTAEGDCELWEGSAKEQEMDGLWVMRFRLCPKGPTAITGEAQYDHPDWGYSIRALEGSWEGTHLRLRETRFVVYKPAPGWDFCLMDSYDFERPTPATLAGKGVSKACGDYDTRYEMRRVRAPAPPPSGSQSGGASLPPAPPGPTVPDGPPLPPAPVGVEASAGPRPDPPAGVGPVDVEPRRKPSCGCALVGSAAPRSSGVALALGLGAAGAVVARRRRARRLVGSASAVLATLGAAEVEGAMVVLPPACSIWRGTAIENDGTDAVRLELCARADGSVTGKVRYETKVGWSVRLVAGAWSALRLELRETSFVESHPTGGWTFCLMDAYHLELARDELRGVGSSLECRDPSTAVSLKRVAPPRPERERAPAPPPMPGP